MTCILKQRPPGDIALFTARIRRYLLQTRRCGVVCTLLAALAGGIWAPAMADATHAPASAPGASGRPLTFQDVFGPGKTVNAYGDQPRLLCWTPDGSHYLQQGFDPRTRAFQIISVAVSAGTTETLFDSAAIEKALQTAGADHPRVYESLSAGVERLDSAAARLLVEADNGLWVYERGTGRSAQVTKTTPVTNETFSPNGRWVSYVRAGNLYVAASDGSVPERALTTDGGPLLYNGRLDWVYEEEVYGRGDTDGYAWSPDSRRIAFLRIDESPVKPFPILDPIPYDQGVEQQRYPLAGDPNPVVTLGVAAVADAKTPVAFLDTSAYPDQDRLIVRFGWTPDSGKVVYEVQNRTQTRLDLLTAAPEDGKPTRILQETTAAWVDVIGLPLWLKDGTFLWRSDRTGFRHLYHYKGDGTLLGAVTQGEWDVLDVYGVDERRGCVYVSADIRSPIGADGYRVRLDGKSAPELLTDRPGTHTLRLDPTCTRYLDTWSDILTPPQVRLFDAAEGRLVRVISDNAALVAQLRDYRISKPELRTLKARDGYPLNAILIRPMDADPKKRYPVFCEVYGGPGYPLVRNAWKSGDYLWYQLLAQKGYNVWLCDNRSASSYRIRSQWTLYKNPGEGELKDIEDGLTYLKAQPGIDGNRVAIYGWSYGGFMVEYALTHSKSFKVGIAGAGVSDWRLYDTIYTERYLDLPSADPDGYQRSAPTGAAADLSGKLLLIHGLADDNVHLQNTSQLIYALERAGRQFDLALYPRSRHGIGDPVLYRHLQQRILDYLSVNL